MIHLQAEEIGHLLQSLNAVPVYQSISEICRGFPTILGRFISLEIENKSNSKSIKFVKLIF